MVVRIVLMHSLAFLVSEAGSLQFKMQAITLIFAALFACVYAQVSISPNRAERYGDKYKFVEIARHQRDLKWERNAGKGKVFGTLGSTDDSLFGKAGYKQELFNDRRGQLQGQAYGKRVLGANGDVSSFGSKLDWSDNNARVSADLNKEIGGRSGITVTGEGKWKLDKNTRVYAGGHVQKTFGHEKPDIGIGASIEHDF